LSLRLDFHSNRLAMLPEPTTLNSVARLVAETLREVYAIEPEAVFRRAGVDFAQLDVARGRYAYSRMQKLWQVAAAESGDPCFGLRAGERVRPLTFGILGVAWLGSESLREALRRLVRFARVVTTAPMMLAFQEDPPTLRFGRSPGPVESVTVDALLAAVLVMARLVSRPGLAPVELRLAHADHGRAAEYRKLFACRVVFDAPDYALTFRAADLDERLAGHEAEIARRAELAAERYLGLVDCGRTTAEVRRALSELLLSGPAGIAEVAARLHRGTSTLQRQLQQEGVTYRGVLDGTRRMLAEGWLADGETPLSQIAYLLGFADQSGFARAFRRWTGVSPSDFRRSAPEGLGDRPPPG
jgi:AraC-like DNA-binding protein